VVCGVDGSIGRDGTYLIHAFNSRSIFHSAYGSEVGSTAIKFIPTGGLFVTGGLTPKNIKFIEGAKSEFMKAYHDKGRVSTLLSNIPLFAVMVEDLGVRGAHKCCQVEFEKLHRDDEPLGAPAPVEVEPLGVAAATAAPFYGPEFLVVSTIAAVAAGVLLGRRK
jgi:glucokinase